MKLIDISDEKIDPRYKNIDGVTSCTSPYF